MEQFENKNAKTMSVKDWLYTLLLLAIPLVGFIMLFVFAFGNDQNENRQNWAKAQLIMMAIMLTLVMIFFIVFGSMFAAAMAARN